MSVKLKLLMNLTWNECRRRAKKGGGNPKDYLSEVLKKQHFKMLQRENNEEIYVVIYRKAQDKYINRYVTIGINPQLKINSKGEEFLQITTPRGSWNYSHFELIKCRSFEHADQEINNILDNNTDCSIQEYEE